MVLLAFPSAQLGPGTEALGVTPASASSPGHGFLTHAGVELVITKQDYEKLL